MPVGAPSPSGLGVTMSWTDEERTNKLKVTPLGLSAPWCSPPPPPGTCLTGGRRGGGGPGEGGRGSRGERSPPVPEHTQSTGNRKNTGE